MTSEHSICIRELCHCDPLEEVRETFLREIFPIMQSVLLNEKTSFCVSLIFLPGCINNFTSVSYRYNANHPCLWFLWEKNENKDILFPSSGGFLTQTTFPVHNLQKSIYIYIFGFHDSFLSWRKVLYQKMFWVHEILNEFTIGTNVKLSSAVAAILVGRHQIQFWKRST